MDEPIFEGDEKKAPEGAEKGNGAATPAAPAAPAENEALKAEVSALKEQLGQVVGYLQQQQQPAAPTAAPEPPPKADDDLTALSQSPRGFIEEIIAKKLEAHTQENINPVAMGLIESQHRQIVREFAQGVDEQFGEGVWDETFKPELDPFFNQLRKDSPASLSNIEALEMLVDRVKGKNMGHLSTKATEFASNMEKEIAAEREEIVKTLPLGNIRRTPSDTQQLTEDEKGFLKHVVEKTGEPIDEKEFMAFHQMGNSLEDYEAYLKAQEEKK